MAIEYVDSTQLDSDLTGVADAIRAKSGGSGQLAFPAGFVSEIQAIPTGSTFDEDADFCFWDYDGTPLYSFSRAEIQAMTELPSPPDHSQDDIPLTFLYWNWTLAELQDFDGVMDVGACYKPTDGKAHWFYRLTEASGLSCSFTLNNTTSVMINWGDGTGDEAWGSSTENGSSVTHTYSQPGLYHVTMLGEGRPSTAMRTEGNDCLVGQFVVGDNQTRLWLSSWWSSALENSSIETIVTNDRSANNSFISPSPNKCRLLKAYVFNPYYVNIQSALLQSASSCEVVCFSNKTISTIDYLCSGMTRLKRIRLSPNTKWRRFAFSSAPIEFFNGASLNYKDLEACNCLRRLVIKSTIDNSALSNCNSIEEIWCGLATPPALGSSTPFSKLKSNAVIHVPAESVEDYKAATNWSIHADKIVGDWTADPVK